MLHCELFTYCEDCLIDSNGTIDFTEYRGLLDLSKRRHERQRLGTING